MRKEFSIQFLLQNAITTGNERSVFPDHVKFYPTLEAITAAVTDSLNESLNRVFVERHIQRVKCKGLVGIYLSKQINKIDYQYPQAT